MLWFFTLIAQVLFGEELCSYVFGNKQNIYTKVAVGIPLGIGISTIIFFLCSMFLGFSKVNLLVHTGVISFLSYGSITARLIKKNFQFSKPMNNQIIYLVSSACFSLFFTYYCYPLGNINYNLAFTGDFEEEIALINSFYHGCNSGFSNIFKIRHPFGYKFVARTRWLTSMHSAIMKIGLGSTKTAIFYPSILYVFSFCFNMQQFSDIIFHGNYWYSLMSIIITLLMGGTGMFAFVTPRAQSQVGLDYVFNYGLGTTTWSHPILQYIYAYRCSQMTLSIASAILFILKLSKNKAPRKEMVLLGFLTGILLPTQFPAFIACLIFLSVHRAIIFPYGNKTKTKNQILSILFFAGSVGIAIIVPLFQFVPRATNAPLIEFTDFCNDNVNSGSYFPLIKTWWQAFGFGLPFIILSPFFLDKPELNMFGAAFVVFAIGNKVSFYAYQRMNISFFYPFCITLSAVAIVVVVKSIISKIKDEETQGIFIGLAIVLTVMLTMSSILGLWTNRKRCERFWPEKYEAPARWIADNTPVKSVFIADGEYGPAAALAGRVLFTHGPRAIWVYGFNNQGRREEQDILLANPHRGDLAPKVEYVLSTNGKYPWINTVNTTWSVVYEIDGITIFKRNLVRKKK